MTTVEINLLPEKEKRDITNLVVILVIALILLSSSLVLRYFHSNAVEEVEQVQKEIQEVQILSQSLREQMELQQGSDLDRLAEKVYSLEGVLVPASSLLDLLVGLLPERGYFLNYDYSLPDVVTFNASFVELEDIAYYSNILFQSEIIKEVQISNINTHFPPGMDEDEFSRDEILPRYVGSFQLKINMKAARELRDQP